MRKEEVIALSLCEAREGDWLREKPSYSGSALARCCQSSLLKDGIGWWEVGPPEGGEV